MTSKSNPPKGVNNTNAKRGRKTSDAVAAQTGQEETAQGQPDETVNMPVAQQVGSELADRDLANQLHGRIQLARGISEVLTVSTLMDMQKIKNSNGYKGISIESNGKVLTVSTWEEYCNACGFSRQKVDNDILNLEAFGAQALESMQHAKIGYRELRQLRKLPEDDRQVIIEQVETDVGDKEAILELIDELSTKHVKDKEKLSEEHAQEKGRLETQIANLRKADEANQKVLDDKEAQIRQLHLEAKQNELPEDEALKKRVSDMAALRQNLLINGACSIGVLRINLRQAENHYGELGEAIPVEIRDEAAMTIQVLRDRLDEIAEEFGLWEHLNKVMDAGTEQWNPDAEQWNPDAE